MGTCNNIDEIEILIRARYPIINIVSWEEERVMAYIGAIGKKRDKKVFSWSFNTGIVPLGTALESKQGVDTATKDPLLALNKVLESMEPALYVFRDFHPFMARNNYAIIRRLREVSASLKHSYKTLILLSPQMYIADDLEKDITVVDFPLPTLVDLNHLLEKIIDDVKDNPKITIDLDEDGRGKLLRAALGLTIKEAENVFARILVTDGHLDADNVQVILSEKKQIIRKAGLLEYYDCSEDFNYVGGLDLLKEWLQKRGMAFSDSAVSFGLPAPKGVLFLGIQGCGKSLCAKAVASAWGLPLLRFDVGKLFESALGSSEENIRRAIKIAETVSPCVLWIDEIEKAFGGVSGSSGMTDGGTTARIFGSFLTWLAEKNAPVFVIATANDIKRLPPELLRKGRFDEIFFVDLPNRDERRDIFYIQLIRHGRDPGNFDLEVLSDESVGFSGAEIAEGVISGLYEAFYAQRDLLTEDIVGCLQRTVPLSLTMKEELKNLRNWCSSRARPASAVMAEPEIVDERKIEFQ